MRQGWGLHLVIINKRGKGCPCPLCVPFVGKIMIDDVWSGGSRKDGKYPLMSSAVAAGLYHPRCRDSHTTYFPGITKVDPKYGIMPKAVVYSPAKVEDATATYNWIDDAIYISNNFNDPEKYLEKARKSERSLTEYNEHYPHPYEASCDATNDGDGGILKKKFYPFYHFLYPFLCCLLILKFLHCVHSFCHSQNPFLLGLWEFGNNLAKAA